MGKRKVKTKENLKVMVLLSEKDMLGTTVKMLGERAYRRNQTESLRHHDYPKI